MPESWDELQDRVITAEPSAYQVVESGPGTGKTAVACARVAYLIDSGVPAPNILLLSFTRTAVAEIRNRIASYVDNPHLVSGVKITTLDSHAWYLRNGFSQAELSTLLGDYDANIERVLELFQQKSADLLDFINRFDHLIVDEAQDVVSIRAEFVVELIRNLREDCGVTIFSDSAQAIYGFTQDDESDNSSEANSTDEGIEQFFAVLAAGHQDFESQELKHIYRTDNPGLIRIFEECRKSVLETGVEPKERLEGVRRKIQDLSSRNHEEHSDLRGRDDTLVLYRRRAEVLLASSFLCDAGIEHRIRMSHAPTVVHPWIGRLFGACMDSRISREEFDELWEQRYLEQLFAGVSKEAAWDLLVEFAADGRGLKLDLERLKRILGRSRPPVEFCKPECGWGGPIIGTIHASKGREAPRVVLMLSQATLRDDADFEEESRVLYVGATRARKMLEVGKGYVRPAKYLDESGRVFWVHREKTAAQIELGRTGDLDPVAHVSQGRAGESQKILTQLTPTLHDVTAKAHPEWQYAHRLFARDGARFVMIGQLSQSVTKDLWSVAREVQRMRRTAALKPPAEIRHLYTFDVGTTVITEDLAHQLDSPYKFSRMFLSPVIRGFSMAYFGMRRR